MPTEVGPEITKVCNFSSVRGTWGKKKENISTNLAQRKEGKGDGGGKKSTNRS